MSRNDVQPDLFGIMQNGSASAAQQALRPPQTPEEIPKIARRAVLAEQAVTPGGMTGLLIIEDRRVDLRISRWLQG